MRDFVSMFSCWIKIIFCLHSFSLLLSNSLIKSLSILFLLSLGLYNWCKSLKKIYMTCTYLPLIMVKFVINSFSLKKFTQNKVKTLHGLTKMCNLCVGFLMKSGLLSILPFLIVGTWGSFALFVHKPLPEVGKEYIQLKEIRL